MSAQIVFRAKNESLKKKFSQIAKQNGIPMSTIFNMVMEWYISGQFKFWLITPNQSDLHELDYSEVTPEMQKAIAKAKKTPKHLLHNI